MHIKVLCTLITTSQYCQNRRAHTTMCKIYTSHLTRVNINTCDYALYMYSGLVRKNIYLYTCTCKCTLYGNHRCM